MTIGMIVETKKLFKFNFVSKNGSYNSNIEWQYYIIECKWSLEQPFRIKSHDRFFPFLET